MLIASCPAYINPKWYKKRPLIVGISFYISNGQNENTIWPSTTPWPIVLARWHGFQRSFGIAPTDFFFGAGHNSPWGHGTRHGFLWAWLATQKKGRRCFSLARLQVMNHDFLSARIHDSCLLLFSLANPWLLFLLATFTTLTVEENVLPPRCAVFNGSVVSMWPTSEPITLKPKKSNQHRRHGEFLWKLIVKA